MIAVASVDQTTGGSKSALKSGSSVVGKVSVENSEREKKLKQKVTDTILARVKKEDDQTETDNIHVTAFSVPEAIRETANQQALSMGKLTIFIQANKKGHKIRLRDMQQRSIHDIAEMYGGFDQLVDPQQLDWSMNDGFDEMISDPNSLESDQPDLAPINTPLQKREDRKPSGSERERTSDKIQRTNQETERRPRPMREDPLQWMNPSRNHQKNRDEQRQDQGSGKDGSQEDSQIFNQDNSLDTTPTDDSFSEQDDDLNTLSKDIQPLIPATSAESNNSVQPIQPPKQYKEQNPEHNGAVDRNRERQREDRGDRPHRFKSRDLKDDSEKDQN